MLPSFPAEIYMLKWLSIGGSVAGLLQGLQLKRNGTNVVVLEQDPSKDRHSHESGVTIGPSVVALLNKYDATGRPASIFAEYMSLAWRKRLRVINRPYPHHMSNWGCLYLILRANFDGMKSETVPEPPAPRKGDGAVEYRPGKRAVGVSYDKRKGVVTVTYIDVTTGEEGSVSAETVIAADGVHSSVARILQVPVRKDYAGYIAWRGTVPEARLSPATIEYFSNRLNFSLLKGTYFIR
jgi:2-polyprenyl-6-methoxyphenol hydroxylase-like FAD-dependent oxidoreductase